MINMCLGCFSLFILFGTLGFLDLIGYFLHHFRDIFNYYCLKYFLMAFLSSSSGIPMIWMLGHLTLSQRSLRLSSFNSFFFFPLCFIYFYHSIFHLTYPIFYLSYSTVGSLQSAFDLSYFIINVWLFFISSRPFISSRLNISCIFSILVSNPFICNSILFSRFWIIFTIIILNSFSGRLPISSPFVWFGGH